MSRPMASPLNLQVAEPFRAILNTAAAVCRCEGEYIAGRETPVMSSRGCIVHGACDYCQERLGVAFDPEPLTKREWWACAQCLALCRECGENPHSPLCPEHPERRRERELLEMLYQEQARENERLGRGMRWIAGRTS